MLKKAASDVKVEEYVSGDYEVVINDALWLIYIYIYVYV